jgi:hypothetical protein
MEESTSTLNPIELRSGQPTLRSAKEGQMTVAEELILISVDDHVIEPPDLFVGHLSGEYLDRAPKLERRPDGSDVWVFNQVEIENSALNAVAGRPREEYGLEPQSLEEISGRLLRREREDQRHERRRGFGVDEFSILPDIHRSTLRH